MDIDIKEKRIRKVICLDEVDLTPDMQGWFYLCKSTNVIHHITKLMKKTIGLSPQTQKAFDKIQHSFLSKLGIQGTFLTTIKARYEKPIGADYSMEKIRRCFC